MNTKLTLSIDKSVIESAKQYAKSQGRSLSAIIEEYLKSVSKLKSSKIDSQDLHPLVKELSGSVKIPNNKSYDEVLAEALIEKYSKR
jgi:hypothetical protein